MFAAIGQQRCRFHDFRHNGILLPCREQAALRTGLPLHRGPHPRYSAIVLVRVGAIESAWSRARSGNDFAAAVEAHMRIAMLQNALRRLLLSQGGRRMVLNRRDPRHAEAEFRELDAMADALWGASDAA